MTRKRKPSWHTMVIMPPLPGERRKSSMLLLCFRNWRSKWIRVLCMGGAKKCRAGECQHAEALVAQLPRAKAHPRD